MSETRVRVERVAFGVSVLWLSGDVVARDRDGFPLSLIENLTCWNFDSEQSAARFIKRKGFVVVP